MWLEVEVKAKIDNVPALRKKIKKIAKFDKKESRADDYFALKRKFRKHAYPKKAFRIRTTKKDSKITFKKWRLKHWDRQIVVKEEFEFEIKDPANFLALMQDLGFVQWVKKFKTTESYKYKKDKNIIIEINHVRHLGYFLEMEYLAHPKDMKKAKRKIKAVLKELGIKQKQIDNTGYTKMLWKKNKKGKRFFILKRK